MLFHKTPYASNFSYTDRFDANTGQLTIGNRVFQVKLTSHEGDIYHLQIANQDVWPEDCNIAPLTPPGPLKSNPKVKLSSNFEISLEDSEGQTILTTPKGFGFGVCGKQSIFTFGYSREMRFYGLGEKTFGRMEVSNVRSRFWNVDAMGDFHQAQWMEHTCDPYYVSVPYVIVRQGETYLGLLLHNPFETWIDTGTDYSFFGTEDANRKVVLGAEDGLPSLWIILGPSLQELTRKLQKLVGVTPRPPLWALGYHQCRWEYKGVEHMEQLHQNMVKHRIPNDGLWLDIDYMEGYRVFTFCKDAFPNGPAAMNKRFVELGRKIVPILDPGVKLEQGFKMYDEGLKAGHFCLTAEGKPFVGFVWPGETVFPDFSKESVREWWAGYAKAFKELGFAGAWVDMNDPSTGSVDPYAMLFRDGAWPHGAFRNQYALGMQMATHQGFQAANPNERVFILSRSGYTGSSRFAAIWTGDNVSNRWYLKGSIPATLSLSLSGIPFNGPDVGGFMGNTTEPLMLDWTKAGFLFPFFRNHSGGSHRRQEPWTFSKAGLNVITWYTSLRYKLMPYLYQQFIAQEADGDPMLRPVQYHFPGGKVPDDMFLVGQDILQAPCLEEGKGRKVKLPGRGKWFDARWGKWVKGAMEVECGIADTPMWFRDGAIIPTLVGIRRDNAKDLREIELHIFLSGGSTELAYVYDDGETLDYKRGKESAVLIKASVSKSGKLSVATEQLRDGYGELKSVRFFFYGEPSEVRLNGKKVRTKSEKVTWTGLPIQAVSFG